MKIANAEHQGRSKVVVSDGNGVWLDVAAGSIQELLDSGRFGERP